MTTTPPDAAHRGYRPDLDGVRAIAVLLVLFYHAGLSWLSGGYIGVDVFFVLTGYLITSLLVAGIERGTFTFREFYLRRIRRILPALVVVLTAIIVAGFLLLLPEDLLTLLDTSRYVLLSAGNFYFWLKTGGYFDADIHDMPLLHTWSLGVEEQFYLLWPAVLVVAHRFIPKRMLPAVLGGVAAVGLLVSHWMAVEYPNPAYYLLPARAFEILVGALVAVLKLSLPAGKGVIRSVVSLGGLLLILVPSLTLTSESTFPGLNAAWPCLGTAVLIVTGSGTGVPGIVNRLVGVRPIAAIGLISYSLYLWHWPIVAFLNYRAIALQGAVPWIVVAVSIALAGLSYFTVEQPFRNRVRFSFRASLVGFAVVPVVIGFSLYAAARHHDGYPDRFPGNLADDRPEEDASSDGKCPYSLDLQRVEHCVVGRYRPEPDGLIVGDSYANMHVPFMDVLARDAGLSFRHLCFRVTPPLPGISAGPRPDRKQFDFINGRHRLLEQQEFSVLISSWGGYSAENEKNRLWDAEGRDVSAEGDQRMLDVIAALLDRGRKVILVDRPRAPPGPAVMKEIRTAVAKGQPLDRFRTPIRPRPAEYLLDRVAKAYPGVLILRPWEAICDAQACHAAIGDLVLYRMDGSHLTEEGSRALGERYLRVRGNPLRRFKR